MKVNELEKLEFRDLDDGLTTVVTIQESCLGDETVSPIKTELREGLLSRIDSGRRSFVVNLGHVVMLDSCGLAAIISTKRLLDDNQSSLALTNLSDLLERLFHLTRLDRVIEIHPTEAEALSA
jgi:anti-anti-sigma factor